MQRTHSHLIHLSSKSAYNYNLFHFGSTIYIIIMIFMEGFIFIAFIYSVTTFYTIPLHNGILTPTAGYSATIYLGTPLKPFEVQIDTGSTRLAVRCGDNNRSSHKNPNFDPSQSNSSQKLTCAFGPFVCQNCNQMSNSSDTCQMHKAFIDGSFLKGTMYRDTLSMGSNYSYVTQHNVGCIEEESEEFSKDKSIDGLWGVARGFQNDEYGNFVRADKYMVEASKKFNRSRTLGLCLALNGGFMTIGGVNRSLNTLPGVFIFYDDPYNEIISNSLGPVIMNGDVIVEDAGSTMPQLIIDSGSTFSQVSYIFFDSMVSVLKKVCMNNSKICKIFQTQSSLCFGLKKLSQLSIFPDVELYFSGRKINWKPTQFLFQSINYANQYCLEMTKHESFFVLGSDFMLNKNIIFQDTGITIFPQSKCQPTPNIELKSTQLSTEDAYDQPSKTLLISLMAAGVSLLILLTLLIGYYVNRRFGSKKEQNKEVKGQLKFEEPKLTIESFHPPHPIDQ